LRRSKLAIAIAAFVFSFTAQPALAGAPSRDPIPPFHDLFTAGTVCPFPVAVDGTFQNETATSLANGTLLITGASFERITNMTTGKSIVLNASGPLKITFGDTSLTARAEGRTLFSFFAGDVGPAVPGLVLTTGLVIITQDFATGRITSFTHAGGTTENLCLTLG
jgi:hypothetical protein